MTDTNGPNEHTFVHENLAAYLAGGLTAEERAKFDSHIHACPECFDAFTEARDADLGLKRTLGVLAPLEIAGGDAGGAGTFEDHMVTKFRERSMNSWKHPAIRRVMYATAACAALAATGVFANFAIHQGGRFSNPLSERLVAQADKTAPDFGSFKRTLKDVVAAGNEKTLPPITPPMARSADRRQTGLSYATSETDDFFKAQMHDIDARISGKDNQALLAEGRRLYDAEKFKESAVVFGQAAAGNPGDGTAQIMQRIAQAKIADVDHDSIQLRSGHEGMAQSFDAPLSSAGPAAATAPSMAMGAVKYSDGFDGYAREGGQGNQSSAVQPGLFEQHMKGMEAGAATARPGVAVAAAPGIGAGYQSYKDLPTQYYAQADQEFWKDDLANVAGPQVTLSGGTLVAGSNEFTKSGSGAVTLANKANINLPSGTANTFTRGTTGSGGTVQIGGGGKLDVGADAARGTTVNGTLAFNGGSLTVNNGTLATTAGNGRESLPADASFAHRYTFADGKALDGVAGAKQIQGDVNLPISSTDESETLKLVPNAVSKTEDSLEAQMKKRAEAPGGGRRPRVPPSRAVSTVPATRSNLTGRNPSPPLAPSPARGHYPDWPRCR